MINAAWPAPVGLDWYSWMIIVVCVFGLFMIVKWLSSEVDALVVTSFSMGLGLFFFGDFVVWWLDRLGLALLVGVIFYLGFIYKPQTWYSRMRQRDVRFLFVFMLFLLYCQLKSGRPAQPGWRMTGRPPPAAGQ